MGPTGSGKTTLIHLILRLYDPNIRLHPGQRRGHQAMAARGLARQNGGRSPGSVPVFRIHPGQHQAGQSGYLPGGSGSRDRGVEPGTARSNSHHHDLFAVSVPVSTMFWWAMKVPFTATGAWFTANNGNGHRSRAARASRSQPPEGEAVAALGSGCRCIGVGAGGRIGDHHRTEGALSHHTEGQRSPSGSVAVRSRLQPCPGSWKASRSAATGA